MRKEIKNFDKIVGIALIVLTTISLLINSFHFTYAIYDTASNITKLNQLLISTPLKLVLWVDNILIYILGLIYVIDAIKAKKDMLLKISFSLFSVLTTMLVATGVINLIANLFGLI